MAWLGPTLLAAVLYLSATWSSEVGEALVRNTVRLSLAWYLVALLLMLRLRVPAEWQSNHPVGRAARWCWTWAVVTFLVHLAMAFHYYHHWSHTHAFERTREVSGVGEGIYVSYLFTILWCADLIWWWSSSEAYARRSPAIDKILHAFLLFIVVNGTIVFEAGAIRWAGLAGLIVLTLAAVKRFGGDATPGPAIRQVTN